MKLSKEHIDPRNGDFPFRKISFLEIAEDLDPKLTLLLRDELSSGNYIWEATRDCLHTGSLSVFLSHPFKIAHRIPEGIKYIVADDSHYNFASYVTEDPAPHTLNAPLRE
jgi:hypothetical protein